MTSKTRTGEAVSDEMERGLTMLARKGAHVARAAVAPNSASAEMADVYCQQDGNVRVVGQIAIGQLRALVALEFASLAGERFVVTRVGREQARRLRAERLALGVHDVALPRRGRKSRKDLDIAAMLQPGFNPDESSLSKLRHRVDKDGQALITKEQYEAGERLRYDLWRAGISPRVTRNWDALPQSKRSQRSAPGVGIDVPEGTVAARERAIRALAAVGTEYIDLLIDVCGHLKGLEEIERTASLPQRSARRFLQHALTALARHYGLLPAEVAETLARARLLHWGGPRYRLPARADDDNC